MNRRCHDTAPNGDRCERPAHDPWEMHRRGVHVWGSRDTVPEWRKRGTFRRDLTGIER